MGSGPDHLQAHNVLGVDSGGAHHTHAMQFRISFFRFDDAGDHSRQQQQQPQEQQPGAGPEAGGAKVRSYAHDSKVREYRAVRAGALQTSGAHPLAACFIPTVRKPGVGGEELWREDREELGSGQPRLGKITMKSPSQLPWLRVGSRIHTPTRIRIHAFVEVETVL